MSGESTRKSVYDPGEHWKWAPTLVARQCFPNNANTVTTGTFIQSPVTTKTPRKKIDVPNERKFSLDVLAETIKIFNRLTLQSTINDYADYHSDKYDTQRDPKSDQVVATHTSDRNNRKVTATDTTKGNYPHRLLKNRRIPAIAPAIIPPIKQMTADGVATSGRACMRYVRFSTRILS